MATERQKAEKAAARRNLESAGAAGGRWHVRNAVARFEQVEGVSDAERDKAWKRILAAAKRYDVDVSESSWRDLAHGGNDSR